ncbi:malto-oligosyltrehalose synthase [Aestuariimicrobium kwangyangense]|uniref:malto-oligosyltrehalose synthase n=1 Tax=Aestuariimicrobium kwangyangense TaxID=396389 RepID=UPI0004064778|nr:malto-oligosyltrehalose synthase [Aestuariimicrobium kwangyangense]
MRIPASTYRLQITEDFDLLEAAKRLTYLHALGIDWVYLSPLLSAGTGSTHGYDVSDHSAIDPTRGRGAGLAALANEAHRLGMGVLVDIVPNHVGVARPWENPWWWHVLTHGQSSPWASAFDIDWEASGGKVRIPVVGDDDLNPDGTVANLRVLAGELHYHDNRYPLAPDSGGPDDDPSAVHGRQHYELVSWRRADTDLNYRRFFAVNDLVAIRVEDPEWFARSHEEIRRWFTEGQVDGLRVDHPDGLRDPVRYLDDLAALTTTERSPEGAYVLVEKILEPGEELPTGWATAGTTGYDLLGLVDRVLVDPQGMQALSDLEDELRGHPTDWPSLIHDTKRTVADTILNSEVRRIARDSGLLHAPDGQHQAPVDEGELIDAVAELLACFPVYRSYLPEGREHLEQCFTSARGRRPELADLFDRLSVVLFDGASGAAQRFQQTSGMVMAKGVEDCAFYRWARLTSLNEVGGDPSVFDVSPDDFHAALFSRQQLWPHAMNAGTTHDTKRGEDVRARISVLAERPQWWAEVVRRLDGLAPIPDQGMANLVWQAIIGAWPATPDPTWRERLHGYAMKAMREAGEHTTWTAPDEAFEAAVHAAVDACFDNGEVADLLQEAVSQLAIPGFSNALAAKLLTIFAPGVPDVYQGSELWEQSLVDPDNRRSVDFDQRENVLAGIRLGDRPRLAEPAGDTDAGEDGAGDPGAVKLLVSHVALTTRRDRPELFTDYSPLHAEGEASEHVLAFNRGGAVAVVTRLPHGLRERGGFGDTTLQLPGGMWVDLLTHRTVSGTVAVADLLDQHPVAVLVRPLPQQLKDGRGRFDVWAPRAERVRLSVGDRVLPMTRGSDDWWRLDGPEPQGEVDYGYVLDDDPTPRPDPRSRRQPEGVHGRSRTFDAASFAWSDDHWHGRPLAGSSVYELHIGTFTPEGTLDAAIGRLDHLVDLGIDMVELMPVSAFNGVHNWGYDGVAWTAVHEPYGGPVAYQRFVDAAHERGLAVVQDVVHNHFGPSGNYLPLFGPYLKEGESPWGALVNLDSEGSDQVRRFILDGVRMWFTDMHVDGLRLDAVHALSDESEVHLLEELALEAANLSAHLGRPLTLIAESDLNDITLVTPREAGGMGVDAQWSDDFHHALHVALTRETDGYYADFEPLAALQKVLTGGFFHDGSFSSFRGREHGAPIDTSRVPGWRLVVCSQNHDQVGNRAHGDRLTEALDDDQLAVAALVTLAGPFTPMLFQGEEWAASSPFQFFTDHPEDDLGRAVSEGRLSEFSRMDWDTKQVPDPQDPDTFLRSKLDWDEVGEGRHARILECYRRLLRLRRALPELTDPDLRHTSCEIDEDTRVLHLRRGGVSVVVNFGDQPVTLPVGRVGALLFSTPAGAELEGDDEHGATVHLPAHAGAMLA